MNIMVGVTERSSEASGVKLPAVGEFDGGELFRRIRTFIICSKMIN